MNASPRWKHRPEGSTWGVTFESNKSKSLVLQNRLSAPFEAKSVFATSTNLFHHRSPVPRLHPSASDLPFMWSNCRCAVAAVDRPKGHHSRDVPRKHSPTVPAVRSFGSGHRRATPRQHGGICQALVFGVLRGGTFVLHRCSANAGLGLPTEARYQPPACSSTSARPTGRGWP